MTNKNEFKLDPTAWVLIVCGALSGQTLNLIGLIYLSEIILPLVALGLIIKHGTQGLFGDRFFQIIVGLQILSLLGFILSDLMVDSIPERFLRGWARLIFLISNTTALLMLAKHDKKYVWAFAFGVGIGLLLSAIISGAPLSDWKLVYGYPIGLIVLCLAFYLPPKVIAVLAMTLGAYSIAVDSRILGATLIITGAVVLSKTRKKDFQQKKASQLVKLSLMGTIGVVLIAAVLVQTNDLYKERRDGSNNGREAGIVVATKAILESPVIGYGSWTQNEKFARMLHEEQQKNRGLKQQIDMQAKMYSFGGEVEAFYPHSQILQVWVEGGIVGASFFIFYCYLLIDYIFYLAVHRSSDQVFPVFFFLLIGGLWEWIASPFAGITRVNIAVILAIIYVLYLERQQSPSTKQSNDNLATGINDIPVIEAYSVLQRKSR